MPEISKELLAQIAAVSNKRARFVLDSIAKNGRVTSEEINHAGYEHPPRAVRDARELGFPIATIKVKHTNGKSIAAYVFADSASLDPLKVGRLPLPKKKRDEIIAKAGKQCQLCGAKHDLQVDHRIPFQVAGETQASGIDPYLVLCGSCNRKKSWSCEHCQNLMETKSLDVCASCYWAEPESFNHVATLQQRRVDLIWTGDDVAEFDRVRVEAARYNRTISEEIKLRLKQPTK
jgi:hypothetical protein